MFKKAVLLVLVVLCLLLACAPKEVAVVEAPLPCVEEEEVRPEVLRMVVIPSDDEVSTREKLQPFMTYLENGIGMKVELVTVVDYAAVVEAMKYGHADLARFGPLNYAQATEEADVEPLITAYKRKTGTAFYNSLIISRPDLEDLNGVDFAYVSPGSGSGYGAPYVYMQENDIELGEVVFAGSHPAVIEAVKNGSVDAGAIADNRWFVALEEGAVTEDEVKIFATSDPIPNIVWAVQTDMGPELKKDLLITFLNMPEETVLSFGTDEIRFVIAHDSDYDIMRKMLEVLD